MRPSDTGRARGLVSSRASGSRVEARTYPPGTALAPLVAMLWTTRWDLRGQPSHVAELLADPCVNLAFERGGEGAASKDSARVVGVSTRLFRRELRGAGGIRAVKLRAGLASALLGPRVASLTDKVVPLSAVFGEVERVIAEVLEPEDDRLGLAALEAWLVERTRGEVPAEASLAARLVERAAAAPELTSVAAFAELAGLSPRQLQRLFREHVGASPKWLLRRFRLQEATARLERDGTSSLTELAAELGYADHAHFTRDFKAATGRTPTSFARQA